MKHFSAALRNDIARALRGHTYEVVEGGRVLIPNAKVYVGGVFEHNVNGLDACVDPNLMVSEGLINLLVVQFRNHAQNTAYYLAPFAGNVAPVGTLTAANFASTQTEFTNYSEATRPQWTPPGADPVTPAIDNSASPGVCTINAAAQTVWGFGLIAGASAKSATTGVLIAATQFAAARSNLNSGDKLNVTYSITATDAG